MISLQNANGNSVSSFGAGNSQFAQGQQTNPFSSAGGSTFGQAARSGMSGAGYSSNTMAPASQTLAGSTKAFGYTDLNQSSRGASARSTGGEGSSTSTAAQLGTDETIGVPDVDPPKLPGQGPEATPVYQVAPPQPSHFWSGVVKPQLGNLIKGDTEGVAEDAAEAAVL